MSDDRTAWNEVDRLNAIIERQREKIRELQQRAEKLDTYRDGFAACSEALRITADESAELRAKVARLQAALNAADPDGKYAVDALTDAERAEMRAAAAADYRRWAEETAQAQRSE